MTFKDPVLTAIETQHISVTKISWLMMFLELITVQSQNHMKLINTLCEQGVELQTDKASGTCSYNWNLKR
jgi:hypothetical protein